MAAPGIIAGIIACLCISGCCCAGCIAQNRSSQAAIQQGLPPQKSSISSFSCCGSSASSFQEAQLRAMQREALIQQDRQNRLEAHLLRQRQVAYENYLNGVGNGQSEQPVMQQPAAVQALPQMQQPVQMPPRALIMTPPPPQAQMQMQMQSQPCQMGPQYAGAPIYMVR